MKNNQFSYRKYIREMENERSVSSEIIIDHYR